MEILTCDNMSTYLSDVFKNKDKKFDFLFVSNNENDTLEFGKTIASFLNKDDVITLNGELGSGKTVLVKGIGEYFNILSQISSPTFTIVNEYQTFSFPIFHFDVYRLPSVDDFLDTIGTDYFSNGTCLIEWGSMLSDILPRKSINIDFEKIDDNKRKIKIWRK